MSIEAPLDLFDFRRSVSVLAARNGFALRECKALELVASELGTNILKHAVRGVLSACVTSDASRRVALRIDSFDEGPPIADFAAALVDGWSAGGPLDPARLYGRDGIGAGLGAIQRMTDEFSYSRIGSQNHFVAVRYRGSTDRSRKRV